MRDCQVELALCRTIIRNIDADRVQDLSYRVITERGK